ncbi:MAG TPA: flippase-like domain-containing protein [Gaiellaceae bacterium]|nr:flippase-like domain-containing protein [Gaiellaceae bacterium]
MASQAGGARVANSPSPRPAWRWRRVRPAVALVLGGVGIYLLLPSLLTVFGSWRSLAHLDWPFAILALLCEVASLVALWELDRVALHTRARFPVATAQLSGNAAGRIFPGGGATAAAVSASMLRVAGIDTATAIAALGAATGLQLATTFALPVLALPAILSGAPLSRGLETAAVLGAAVFLVLVAAGVVVFTTDRPLQVIAGAAQRIRNAALRKRPALEGLPEQVIAARDSIRTTLGRHWPHALLAAAANTAFDYLALLAALRAVGADPHPSLVLLAYTAAKMLALVPITPGGLGFVEAGLVGTLGLAGVPGHAALAATLLYRIVSFWLPLPAGGIAYLAFRRRYRERVRESPDAHASPVDVATDSIRQGGM